MRARFVLNETYDSYKEIEQLSSEIKNRMPELSEENFYDIKKLIKNENKYPLLNGLINSTIGLLITNKTDMRGGFLSPERYKSTVEENVKYKLWPFFDNITADTLHKKFPGGLIVMGSKNSKVFMHELQHAYDNYRSKSKYTSSKRSVNYEKASNKSDQEISRAEAINYFRLPHELSAFFINAINDINFFDNKNKIRPLKDVYKDFIDAFGSWEVLTPKIKKMLVRKLSQYYYKIKEEHEKK